MGQGVRVAFSDGLATIVFANPPVNAIDADLRDQLRRAFEAVNRKDVAVTLLIAEGRNFCVGVDVRKAARQPEPFAFDELLAAMDALSHPLCVAIQGYALGGGLELALACHYRLAAPDAVLALPEVDLGIIPGGRGTQRLPRLVDPQMAIDIAALGDRLDAARALEIGLVDAMADGGSFQDRADRWARAHMGRAVRRTRDLPPRGTSRQLAAAILHGEARSVAERNDSLASRRAMEAIAAAYRVGFEEGMEIERRLAAECKASPEAQRLRAAFLARRTATNSA